MVVSRSPRTGYLVILRLGHGHRGVSEQVATAEQRGPMRLGKSGFRRYSDPFRGRREVPSGSAAFQAAALGKVPWLQELSLPS
ncbi:MAG: hypothetical protein [Olavius algarvensis Gamma 1 endosymbiont]|nr:MAG: hypothetical protein [Olavius algarvensis Gamma 1 endosymbiont]